MTVRSKQRFTLMAAVAGVCTGGIAQADTFNIVVGTENFEVQKRSNTGQYFSSMAQLPSGHRIGFQSNFGNRNGTGSFPNGGITGVYFFQMPVIAAGQEVQTAQLKFSSLAETASTGVAPINWNADLYALGFESVNPPPIGTAPGATAGVETAYAAPLHYVGGFQENPASPPKGAPITKIQDNILTPAEWIALGGGHAARSTSASGDENLGNYMQDLYNNAGTSGFEPGDDHLILRINPDTNAYTGTSAQVNQRYFISTKQVDTGMYPGAQIPELNVTTVRSSEWAKNDSTSNWSPADSWTHGSPNAPGEIATFGAAITGPQTVNVDGNTVGQIRFNNAQSYTLAGTNAIVIDTPVFSGGKISVLNGSHSITAPLQLNRSVNVNVANAADTLTVANLVNPGAAASLVKAGAGKLVISGFNGQGLGVSAGTLEVATNGTAAGTIQSKTLVVADGAILAMNDNDFIVDYTGASPEFTLRDKVKAFRDSLAPGGPAFTSGISYTAGANDRVIAVAEKSEWSTTRTEFNGIPIDDTTIIGKHTYYGDANLDGKVDSNDYVAVDVGLGTGDSWVQGDFNFSGTVTSDDYVAIDTNLGKGVTVGDPLAIAELKAEMIALHTAQFGDAYVQALAIAEEFGYGALVPEPGALSLVGIGAAGLLARRRRQA